MNEAIELLKQKNNYERLVGKWEKTRNLDYGFEILFAHQCESNGLELTHETSANQSNEKTVDFSTIIDGITLNVELVRIGINKGIRELKRSDELEGYILGSDDENPDFRTGAQIIKLQWGILEKVEKFATPDEKTINVICVDCTNVHAGMLDEHDVAIAMWGRPYDPIWVERWEGNRIQGILEADYSQRGSAQFETDISAVMFVRKLKSFPLNQAYVALNNLLGLKHRQLVIETLKKNSAFTNIAICPAIIDKKI